MASVQKISGRWRVRWKDRKPRRSRSITVSTKAAATALARKIEDAVATEGFYRPPLEEETTDVRVMVNEYLEDCRRRLAKGTYERYDQQLMRWVEWMEGGERRPLATRELTRSMLSAYFANLEDVGKENTRYVHRRKPQTIRKHIEAVELFWRWAWENDDGWLDQIPKPRSLNLKRPPPAETIAPTWEEMDMVIAAATGWRRELAVVLRCTGLRVSQAMGLRWEHIDLERGLLHMPGELGKSRQEKRGRTVPLAPVLIEEIKAWGDQEGWLVRATGATATHREARARDMKRVWERTEARPLVFSTNPHHAFRAGFESGLKGLRADNEAVEYLVGHSRGIREHYVGPTALPLHEAVALVPRLP